jgi:hypothetical protein
MVGRMAFEYQTSTQNPYGQGIFGKKLKSIHPIDEC